MVYRYFVHLSNLPTYLPTYRRIHPSPPNPPSPTSHPPTTAAATSLVLPPAPALLPSHSQNTKSPMRFVPVFSTLAPSPPLRPHLLGFRIRCGSFRHPQAGEGRERESEGRGREERKDGGFSFGPNGRASILSILSIHPSIHPSIRNVKYAYIYRQICILGDTGGSVCVLPSPTAWPVPGFCSLWVGRGMRIGIGVCKVER